MSKDIIQLLLWGSLGPFVTWGVFLAYLGFQRANPKRTGAAIFVLSFASVWVLSWVSAVLFNILQILGVMP